MIMRFSAPARRIAYATAQIGIRNTVFSMPRSHASSDITSARSDSKDGESSNAIQVDQTWDSSRGITFKESQRGEALPTFLSSHPTEEQANISSLIFRLDLAETRSDDHQSQNAEEDCTLSIDKAESSDHEDPRYNLLSVKSPLGYHIPEAKMRELVRSPSTYWHYSLYEGPRGEKIKIHYCKSKEATDRVAGLFLDQEVVGFDIEWKPLASSKEGIRKNVALIQLASEERIALFHLALFKGSNTVDNFLAPNLWKVLESPNITKVGVAVKGDCTRLRRFMGIDSRGLFELSHLYKLVKFSTGDVTKINKVLVSLAQQVQEHLHLPLWKGGDVRNSDWSRELDYEQIRYAASDSYAGLQLYHILEGKRKTLSPTPPRPPHAELNLPILLTNGQIVPTDDELSETDEVHPRADSERVLSIEEMARDFVDTAIEKLSPPSSEISTSEPKHRRGAVSVLGPEVSAANNWVIQWRSALSPDYKPRALTHQLRAYALWHEQQQAVTKTAALLRDPPLQAATVATYILEALRTERLPFEVTRLVQVLTYLPVSSQARYRSFLKKSGVTENVNEREKIAINPVAQEEKQC